jgi:hypothetical protein
MQGESYHHYFTSINGIFLAANTNLYDKELIPETVVKIKSIRKMDMINLNMLK